MGLIRLLIYGLAGYFLYRLLFGKKATPMTGGPSQADDVLVEDPVCHLYIPQRGAESLTVQGATHYFCSPECRKKFQSEKR